MLTSRHCITDVRNVTSLTKIPNECFFSSGPLHYCNGAYFLEMAHNFGNPGAIGPYACQGPTNIFDKTCPWASGRQKALARKDDLVVQYITRWKKV